MLTHLGGEATTRLSFGGERHRRQAGRRHDHAGLAWLLLIASGVLTLWAGFFPLAWNTRQYVGAEPPGPLTLRQRTISLLDPVTGLPRAPPKEADVALDYFQRSFPEDVTPEEVLIRRWEGLVSLFGSIEAADELVLAEPHILRKDRVRPRRALHYLTMHFGARNARRLVFDCPYLLTMKSGKIRDNVPAFFNVFGGSKKRVMEILRKHPGLTCIPTGDFYRSMGTLTALMGNVTAAMEVSKEAMARIAKSPRKSVVPEGYPALVAIYGNLEDAHAAIDQQPMLLKWWGHQFFPMVGTLRDLFGESGAREVLRKAPYLLLLEDVRKVKRVKLAMKTMEHLFGPEEARRRLLERPELMAMGIAFSRAMGRAEVKLGSAQAVAENFDSVLRRTGLEEHAEYEKKQRPRNNGYWTPSQGRKRCNPSSWSPLKCEGGAAAIPTGRWDEEDPLENVVDIEATDVVPQD